MTGKFNVGDKVRVVKYPYDRKYKPLGKTGTVSKIGTLFYEVIIPDYPVTKDSPEWMFNEHELELING